MATEDKPGNGAQQPSLNVLAQYVKDFSFESPGAPLSLRPREKAPNIAINVNVNANPLSDTDFDVNLSLEAKATDGKDVLFATELAYGGGFRIVGLPHEHMLPLLFIECPRLLFPFARQIIAEEARCLFVRQIQFQQVHRLFRSFAEFRRIGRKPAIHPCSGTGS